MAFRIISLALWALSTVLLLLIVVAAFFPRLSAVAGPLRPVVDLIVSILDRGDSVAKVTVIAIITVFGWALMEIATRSTQVVREQRAIEWFASLATKSVSTSGHIRLVHTEMQNSVTESPTAQHKNHRALLRVNLINSTETPNLLEALPGKAAVDASNLAARYTPLQVYAWVLPVLGFIGTASGMASSIEGFSSALADTTDTQGIIGVLSEKVIPGLTNAFQTTMLALAASVVIYICATAVRNWDQETLDELDRLSLKFIPLQTSANGGAAPDLTEIIILLREICLQMRRFAQASDRLNTSAQLLEDGSRTLKMASDEFSQLFTFPYMVKIERGKRK